MKTSRDPETLGLPIWKEYQYKLVDRLYRKNLNVFFKNCGFIESEDEFFMRVAQNLFWMTNEKITNENEALEYGMPQSELDALLID